MKKYLVVMTMLFLASVCFAEVKKSYRVEWSYQTIQFHTCPDCEKAYDIYGVEGYIQHLNAEPDAHYKFIMVNEKKYFSTATEAIQFYKKLEGFTNRKIIRTDTEDKDITYYERFDDVLE